MQFFSVTSVTPLNRMLTSFNFMRAFISHIPKPGFAFNRPLYIVEFTVRELENPNLDPIGMFYRAGNRLYTACYYNTRRYQQSEPLPRKRLASTTVLGSLGEVYRWLYTVSRTQRELQRRGLDLLVPER